MRTNSKKLIAETHAAHAESFQQLLTRVEKAFLKKYGITIYDVHGRVIQSVHDSLLIEIPREEMAKLKTLDGVLGIDL